MRNKNEKYIDLHIHTTVSDGSFTPYEVVKQAAIQKLAAIAITDHDTTDGIPEALQAAAKYNVEFIPGVELSAFNSKLGSIHILGLFIDPHEIKMLNKLKEIRTKRINRALKIITKLNEIGFDITIDEIKDLTEYKTIGRPHIAHTMLKKGYIKSIKEAFDRYIGKGKPAYVERDRLSDRDAFQLIKSAGGTTILAHPGLIKVSSLELVEEIKDLKKTGLQAIEAYHPMHTMEQTEFFIKLSKELNLAISGGSDFHGLAKPDIRLGNPQISYNLIDLLRKPKTT